MTLFDECLNTIHTIKDFDERIMELKAIAYSPRSQALNGMPRGGGVNAIEQYIVKIDKLEKRKKELQKWLDKVWNDAYNLMKSKDIADDEIQLMQLRFYSAHSWRACCAIMKKEHPDDLWNENKCFRVYRSILSKINKY